MLNPDRFHAAPWDQAVFAMPCFEIIQPDESELREASATPGHYTVKIDPLADKSALHRHGFYYTDSLIVPRCSQKRFTAHPHASVSIDTHVQLRDILPMCDSSFMHGRFHRDFNLSPVQADRRYKQWLTQLHAEGSILGLCHEGRIAAFIAYSHNSLLLHAVSVNYRGKGLAKYLWSAAIQHLFTHGAEEIHSSISATNLAALNLYSSLGFHFDSAQDIYHRLTS